MPNRIIKESICDSEKLAELTDFEFRLWIGLITQADDAGRGDARPAIIKGRVFPLRERVSVKDIDAALQALAAKGCVSLYIVGGKPYFWFPGWVKHQRVRDCKPKYPSPDDANAVLPQSAASCRKLQQSAALIQSNPNTNPNPNTRESCTTSPDFSQIQAWYNELCPRLPACTTLSEKRKSAIKARLKAGTTMEDFHHLFEKAGKSDFLAGNNDRGWKANIDWLLNEANMVKAMEGNYDNRGKSPADTPEKRQMDEDEIAAVREMMGLG